ncbi:MAG TPA: 16S rRNA (uracil(1498)-N(3))-methyltransferase [Anoxybacillus sp.]|nr:16S rRNA (uracil(1498)-N(3))-methyltransferase [Anoxybacillus sp.]
MQRYFVSNEQFFNNQQITIVGDDYHHIVRVMRMREGEEIVCCNENGKAALCKITKITNDEVIANIIEWVEEQTELPINVYIAQGLPKGDKLELVIQKGTELGAFSFIPFLAARSVVKWDEKKRDRKVERWEKIAKEAAEQSERTRIPSVHHPMTIHELIEFSTKVDYKIIAYEEEARNDERANLTKILREIKPGQSLLTVFGPEGGFSEQEVSLLKENGFISCSLGPRILRTETAPLYLLAAASYELELM